MTIETEVPDEQEITKEIVEEAPAAETPDIPTAEQLAENTRILKEVQEKLGKPGAGAQPTPEQIAEANRILQVVAPMGEKIAWIDIKSSKAGTSMPITPEIEKEMREELKTYPPQSQGDSILLEKVYRMAVGTIQLKGSKPAAAGSVQPIGRRIVSGNPSPGGNGGSSGTTRTDPASSLSAEERTVARKMGIEDREYAKWKGNKNITGPDAPK